MVKQVFYALDVGSISIAGTDQKGAVKEIRITGGERPAELVTTFGSGANTYLIEKQQGAIETTINYIVRDANLVQYWAGGSSGSGALTYSGAVFRTTNPTIVYKYDDNYDVSGAEIRITLGSCIVNTNEIGLTQDGHLEGTLGATCNPADFRYQYTANRGLNPIA